MVQSKLGFERSHVRKYVRSVPVTMYRWKDRMGVWM